MPTPAPPMQPKPKPDTEKQSSVYRHLINELTKMLYEFTKGCPLGSIASADVDIHEVLQCFTCGDIQNEEKAAICWEILATERIKPPEIPVATGGCG